MKEALKSSMDEIATIAVSASGLVASAWMNLWAGVVLFGTLFALTLVGGVFNIYWRVHE